jgi:hypothetical protein
MPTTVTWNDGVTTPTVLTLSDDVMTALESLRNTMTATADGVTAPIYPSVQVMVVGGFTRSLVLPALAQFPPASVQTAQAAVVTAQAALALAQAAVVPGL